MNQEIKQKWVAALKSGEYQQGRGHLRNEGDKYCCLGVLCDIWAKETGTDWQSTESAINGRTIYLIAGAGGFLPQEVQDWAGVDRANPRVNDETLSTYNDSFERTFEEIADLIDKNL